MLNIKNALIAITFTGFLAGCANGNFHKPIENGYSSGSTANASTVHNLRSEDQTIDTGFRITAVSGLNTAVNNNLNTVINNKVVKGQIRGRLADYYYLDLQKGDKIFTEISYQDQKNWEKHHNNQLDHYRISIILQNKFTNATTYAQFLPRYENRALLTGKYKIMVISNEPQSKTPFTYQFKITVKHQNEKHKAIQQ